MTIRRISRITSYNVCYTKLLRNLHIFAEKEGLSHTEATVKVEYVPEQKVFMDEAKTYTISKMIEKIDSLGDTAIKMEGKAGSLTSEENKQTFVLASEEDIV